MCHLWHNHKTTSSIPTTLSRLVSSLRQIGSKSYSLVLLNPYLSKVLLTFFRQLSALRTLHEQTSNYWSVWNSCGPFTRDRFFARYTRRCFKFAPFCKQWVHVELPSSHSWSSSCMWSALSIHSLPPAWVSSVLSTRDSSSLLFKEYSSGYSLPWEKPAHWCSYFRSNLLSTQLKLLKKKENSIWCQCHGIIFFFDWKRGSKQFAGEIFSGLNSGKNETCFNLRVNFRGLTSGWSFKLCLVHMC